MRPLRPQTASALLLAAGLLAASACEREVPAAELGRALFADPSLSTSPFKTFSCKTCHAALEGAPPVVPGRFDPGYNLAGAPSRGGWWGGYAPTLLDAINVCLVQFMGGRALTPQQDEARQLDAYLEAHDRGAAAPPAPFTVVPSVNALADRPGDAGRGRDIYAAACARCHGQPHTGEGRITARATTIPEDTLRVFPDNARTVIVEKIRHGRFFNIGGTMPLYSVEAMSDDQIADLLAFLGVKPF
jgi:thiosulfate dehydrogenase